MTAAVVVVAALVAASAILLAAAVWRDTSLRMDAALAILDEPDPYPDTEGETVMTTAPIRFRKRPVVIEAMHYTGTPAETFAVYQWVEANTSGSFEPMAVIEGRTPCPASGVSIDPRDGRMMIATLEGFHHVNLGDWVIRGVQGEFYPVKPDIFAATYEVAGADRQP